MRTAWNVLSQILACVIPGVISKEHDPDHSPDEERSSFAIQLTLCLTLVAVGGVLSGLTLGLMSLDSTNLEILERSGSPSARKYAKQIKPIRLKGHWLLVTLLLSNTIVNESLPIFVDSIAGGGGWAAVLISTTAILVFGEVIPQAICSRYGLAIGSFMAWPVRILMWLMAPVAWPFAKLLDWALGETHGTSYRRAELKALVQLHQGSSGHVGPLSATEVCIIRAVLELCDKRVNQIMTPLEEVYMLNWNQRLNVELMKEIMQRGHSRVPIFVGSDRRQVVGMLLVKRLVGYNPERELPVHAFGDAMQGVPVVDSSVPCFDILGLFQSGKSHMAVVVDNMMDFKKNHRKQGSDQVHPVSRAADTSTPFTRLPDMDKFGSDLGISQSDKGPRVTFSSCVPEEPATSGSASAQSVSVPNILGIVTLEDVIEELLGSEIIDETDLYVNMLRRQLKTPPKMPLADRLDQLRDFTGAQTPILGPESSFASLGHVGEYGELRAFATPSRGMSPRGRSRASKQRSSSLRLAPPDQTRFENLGSSSGTVGRSFSTGGDALQSPRVDGQKRTRQGYLWGILGSGPKELVQDAECGPLLPSAEESSAPNPSCDSQEADTH